jgi:hypothetical protein
MARPNITYTDPNWELVDEIPDRPMIRLFSQLDVATDRCELFLHPNGTVYCRSTYVKDGQGEDGMQTYIVEEWEKLLVPQDDEE